jgi:subtilisin family serine protease
MRRLPFAVMTALALVALAVVSAAAAQPDDGARRAATSAGKSASAVYIVRMVEPPVVAYEGGIAGLRATKPAKGTKIDPTDADVVRYVGHLDSRHADVLARAGGRKVYDYRYAFNGFAARLAPGQVARLQADPDVLSVEKSVEVTMDTATTPGFLGLTDPDNGLWTAPRNIKGEDVVIGIIDSGIWPESKSFSDRAGFGTSGQRTYDNLPSFKGKCASEETTDGSWDANLCNRKLVGARFFCETRGCDTVLEHEFMSPRDYNGHGTHTASTAGGNEGVPTTGAAAVFGSVNGIAPRARVAAYKVCWDNGEGGCGAFTGDSVAAIDQAVADGVDVLNYSIAGTRTNYLDSVEVAYLFAADAGVFVATSAGNSGPTASTVAHISPWLSSVAAGTHSRAGEATVTLGNGAEYTGASLTSGVGPAQLVKSTSVGKADGDDPATSQNEVELCFIGSLDPALTAGKIVQCDRGVNARVDKSAAVKEAGGVGMILTNVVPGSLNADLHSIPTVHLAHTDRAPIQAYIDSAGASATATLSDAVVTSTAPAPDVASFSSRGPSIAGVGDILKPDYMAPGVDILASVAPPGNAGKDFDIYSGTSMSSPHVAGIGALLTQAHPDWSPAAMRSAIATTADTTSRPGLNLPFNTGSGHVRPNLMVNPGLVYDAGFGDYLAFLKGQGLCCASSASIPALDASDLNQPSLAVGDLAGLQTLTRTVTNVSGSAANYTANVVAPAGFTVNVNPAAFIIAPGGTQQFTVTITRTDAPLSTSPTTGYRFGSLTWSDGTHSVRSPIVVRPVAIAAPVEISGTGVSGATSYGIKTGYNGPLAYAKRGLIPSQVFSGTVPDDPTNNFDQGNPAGNQGIVTHDIVVPAGTGLFRISMFDAETDGADDIDLYLYRVNTNGTLTIVGLSAGGTSAEQIQLTNPTAATYRLFVHGWETDGPDANYSLHSWVLGTADAGNMTVTGPTTATTGGTGTVNLSWTGLDAGKRYLGQIRYMEGTTTHGTTIVRVDG